MQGMAGLWFHSDTLPPEGRSHTTTHFNQPLVSADSLTQYPAACLANNILQPPALRSHLLADQSQLRVGLQSALQRDVRCGAAHEPAGRERARLQALAAQKSHASKAVQLPAFCARKPRTNQTSYCHA